MSHEKLFEMACAARENAYAPYSKYKVGACILTESGKTFAGCNFENASYGATICAERCAASCAVAAGERRFMAVAIAANTAAWPCGICRQVMAEFCNGDFPVVLGTADDYKIHTLSSLLPLAFTPDSLK